MKMQGRRRLSAAAAFVELARGSGCHADEKEPQAQAGSWHPFIPPTSAISMKAAWHSHAEAPFVFAVNETFYERIFFSLGNNF